MKTWIKNLIYILPALVFFYACNPEIDVPAPVAGTADFSRYIAVGNSLTAGYADGGLYADGQMQSYPYLIAQQMNEITVSDFKQPDIPGNGSGYLYIKSLDLTGAVPDVGFGQFEADPNWLDQLDGSFNNLGVPGIRVKDITFHGYGSSPQVNPYFYRMLGGKSAIMSYLELVQESQPTFFTSWLGNNDVLGYASSGGAAGIAGTPGIGLNGLTNPDTEFKPSYDALIAALTANGAKGVVVTIPDITLAPFFTTVAWNGAVLDAPTAGLANQFYAAGIDTAIQSKVQVAVISLTVTQTAVSTTVVPPVAQGTVYQQAYQAAYEQAIAAGETPADAANIATAIADGYIASPEGIAAINTLATGLNAELQNHLLGSHANHTTLEPVYALIDNELATNVALQQGIAQGISELTFAYENELLPPAQQDALAAAIDDKTQEQIVGLKAAGIYPEFKEGANGFVIYVPVTASNPLGIRQMVAGEYVLLTALLDGELDGLSALEPKADQYILTKDEVKNIQDYTEDFNNIIRSYASSPDIAVFESNDVLEDVNNGIFADGVTLNGEFLTGGAFSLDGIHLTPRGYSIVANSIIQIINDNFNASISPVNINNYRAVILP